MTEVEVSVSYDSLDKSSVQEFVTSESIISTSDDMAQHNSESNVENDISAVTNDKISAESDNLTRVDNKTQKKRMTLIDSDSEDEIQNTVPQKSSETNSESVNVKSNKKRMTLIDSDSEEENTVDITRTIEEDSEVSAKPNVGKKRITLVDSDSEENENVTSKSLENDNNESETENKSSSPNQTVKRKSRLIQICDSDSDDDSKSPSQSVQTFETDEHVVQKQTMRRLQNLCDSESSGDEPEPLEDELKHISKENIIKQKRVKKTAEPVEKKMTGKDALEQRRQIQSESQKMARETRIHLPYHRPKQHTLQEFLKRKSILNKTVKAPPNTPTGLSIKMLNKNLITAERKLKEKEKEIERFYKSESEDDEPETVKINIKETVAENIEKKTEDDKLEEMEAAEKNDEIVSEKILEDKTAVGVLQEELTEENEQEKVEEEIQQIKVPEQTEQEDISEEIEPEKLPEVEQMEVDEEQTLNEENQQTEVENSDVQKTSINIDDKCLDSEQTEETGPILTETIDETIDGTINEDKEAKIKELRDILDKYLPTTKPTPEETEIPEESSEKSSDLPSSQIEATQIFQEKENKKKKLAEVEEKLKKLNPLIALKGNLQPRLSGGPNELIILDDGIEKSKRVNNLMQRFLNHTVKKHTPNKKTEFSVLNVEGADINKETITLTEEHEDDEPAKKFQIPGVKMKKLRLELTDQIMKKRIEEMKKRQEEIKLDNEDDTYAGEKEDCGKLLDNEEEEELTDTSSEEEEEEEEEDDVEIREAPRVKSAFVDEEAEVSDEEDNEEALENDVDQEDDEDQEDEEEDEPDDPEDEETNLEPASKKPLRRIIKPTEDSDDDTASRPESSIGKEKTNAEASADLFASQTPHKSANWDDNDEIPAYQLPSNGLEKTPCKLATQSKDLTFLTPTLHLTALQGMNSAAKSLQGSPNVNTFLPPEPSPLKSQNIKTKLFNDNENMDDNNIDELENLCSGKFTTQIDNTKSNFSTQENELLNICSGSFTGLTQPESILSVKPTQSLDLLMNEDSQNFSLTIENETTCDSEVSQPLKLSFEEENSNKENIKPEINVSKFPKMIIASSSEDDDKENESPKKKKLKKKKRKYIIDDISITDDDDIEERSQLSEDEPTKNINYDSEENEIELEEYEGFEEEKPVKKASDFFEAEAELSESDWGSEDEDEKNLDNYEVEEGDTEKINETKVQRELERMHMRAVLDEDQREVKMLQEMLLEDGELHGSGRERKFRWKNADSLSWNTDDKPKEDDEDLEEMESELQWRKQRHERELFLKEQQIKSQQTEDDDFMKDSQFFKLGHQALKKSSNDSINLSQKKTPVAENLSKTDDIKLPFALATKRGSFLQRSETTLARLAEITKVTANIGGPKNSKNFIFTSVEKTEIEITEEDTEEVNFKKRKAEDGTPKVMKKLRIADMSPNVQKRKKKLTLT